MAIDSENGECVMCRKSFPLETMLSGVWCEACAFPLWRCGPCSKRDRLILEEGTEGRGACFGGCGEITKTFKAIGRRKADEAPAPVAPVEWPIQQGELF